MGVLFSLCRHRLYKNQTEERIFIIIHTVNAGETLYAIAARYGVDPNLLRVNNGVGQDGALAVGQTLVVQTVRTFHIVQPGQTLTAIAVHYGMTLRELYRNNYFLEGQERIEPGQFLVIEYDDERLREIVTNGYAYPEITRRALSATLPYMSYLSPFTYGLDAQLGLLPLDDSALLQEAYRLGAAPLMHLSSLTEDGSFSSARAAQLLTDEQRKNALIEEIVALMEEKGYQGLDVDFEFIPAARGEDYVRFIRRLRERLAPLGYPVMVALAPKTYAAQPGLLYEAHNYPQLAAAADRVLLMTYEWGYTYGPPMAVAPIENVRRVVEYALTEMPAEKIFLGIPNYGYDWPLPFVQGQTRARSISNQEAVQIAIRYGAEIQFDERAQSPYFRYTAADGVVHEVWFEDARSMAAKLRLVSEYGLYGAGYWNLMRPYPQGWVLLNALYEVQSI